MWHLAMPAPTIVLLSGALAGNAGFRKGRQHCNDGRWSSEQFPTLLFLRLMRALREKEGAIHQRFALPLLQLGASGIGTVYAMSGWRKKRCMLGTNTYMQAGMHSCAHAWCTYNHVIAHNTKGRSG